MYPSDVLCGQILRRWYGILKDTGLEIRETQVYLFILYVIRQVPDFFEHHYLQQAKNDSYHSFMS